VPGAGHAGPGTRAPAPGTRHPGPEPPRQPPSPWFMLVLEGAALVLAGVLTSAGYMLAPSLSRGMLFFLASRENAYVWSGAAGVVLGLGFARLSIFRTSLQGSTRLSLTVAILIGGFAASLLCAIANPLGTVEFFILLAYLLPCSILCFGIAAGRLWAVMTGIILDLLIGLASPAGPERDPAQVALFAVLFLATLELAYSSATFKNMLDREMADVRSETGMAHVTRTFREALVGYSGRLAAALLASSLALAAVIAISSSPGLFGESYAASLEARRISAILWPAILVLGIMSMGLLVPRDILARARKAAVRVRLAFKTFVSPTLVLSFQKAARTHSPRSDRSLR